MEDLHTEPGDDTRVLLRQAAGILVKRRAESDLSAPESTALLEDLFARVIPEEVSRYSAEDLAILALHAGSILRHREAGQPRIRIENIAHVSQSSALDSISVLEILNDDMPFLFDSVLGELAAHHLDVVLVAHPVIQVTRDAGQKLVAYGEGASASRESLIYIHVRRIDDAERISEIVAALQSVLADVQVAVDDWRPMLASVDGVRDQMMAAAASHADMAEAVAFLDWLRDDNFIFLGVRDYAFTKSSDLLEPLFESGLGLLRSPELRILRRAGKDMPVTPELIEFLRQPVPLIVRKAAVRSRVHRRAHMDYVGVRRFDENGDVTGEFRILGLFTSTAYTGSSRTIPFLRQKVAAVFRRSGYHPRSHSGKSLMNVLDTFPRDEMFQIDDEALYHFAIAITELEGRPRTRVLARRDEFNRYVSVLVFIPRDRYSSSVVTAIGDYLATAFQGRVSDTYPSFPEGLNMRIQYIIGRSGGETPNPDRKTLERAVAGIIQNWNDGFERALQSLGDSVSAQRLTLRYRNAFSAGFREAYAPEQSAAEIPIIERLSPSSPRGVVFYRQSGQSGRLGLKIWSRETPLSLTLRVPVLENMGFGVVDERTFSVHPANSPVVWVHDMTLDCSEEIAAAALPSRQAQLESCFLAVTGEAAENDGYNALVLLTGIGWRDVSLLRAISHYLKQIRIPYSQDYMWGALQRYPSIAAMIVELFYVRFDLRLEETSRSSKEEQKAEAIEVSLEQVESLDDDRIIRRFVNAVQSAVRTNYFQLGLDGFAKPTISIKFESAKLESLPAPRPLFEISVYSPRVAGIHLRFGRVARGGLRWSDRPQDFRTEILGLVKAQQVKNAVIVPVGAKGGFVPKRLQKQTSRDEIAQEGIAAYRLFIQAMLDITDNVRVGQNGATEVEHPAGVIRYDEDDPYLVVAADKGTATFSDIANDLARDNGFWLDDAFASGGSAGYDHKKMGITARGAWESVKRHFREMDIDIRSTVFTAVGVGDMSGDVFGNGMLCEKTTKLLAAFDHRDIFIDPDPNPAVSFDERQRLFNLTRSSWQDYNKNLISEGGGVYPRSLKQIELSHQARRALGFDKARVTPQEVMRAILQAPADLLFFGGIGTYVRATTETDAEVGDRANDAIRITGGDIRARVIGEGANLGMTQRGRIEAAFGGVRLNTDAIDNSAGVNTSDIEVNIKIATAGPIREGRLTFDERNKLLTSMTDDVAALVLRNNYHQAQALSLAQARGMSDLGFQQRLMQALEKRGLLDRTVEFMPNDIELAERRRLARPLTRPELSVLLAYAKMTLKRDLLESDVLDQPCLARELLNYFPKPLTDRFPASVEKHRLRRDIVATQLASALIDRGGPALAVRLADQTGAATDAIALAFVLVRDSYDMPELNAEIERLDGQIASETQLSLFLAVQDLLVDRMVWFLRYVGASDDLSQTIAHYRGGIAAVDSVLPTCLPDDMSARHAAKTGDLTSKNVPLHLSLRLAKLSFLTSAPDIIHVADSTSHRAENVAKVYFVLNSYLRISAMLETAQTIPVPDYYDRLALDRAFDEIGDAERKIAAAVVAGYGVDEGAVNAWIKSRSSLIERVRGSINEISATGLTLSKVTLVASLLSDLAGG